MHVYPLLAASMGWPFTRFWWSTIIHFVLSTKIIIKEFNFRQSLVRVSSPFALEPKIEEHEVGLKERRNPSDQWRVRVDRTDLMGELFGVWCLVWMVGFNADAWWLLYPQTTIFIFFLDMFNPLFKRSCQLAMWGSSTRERRRRETETIGCNFLWQANACYSFRQPRNPTLGSMQDMLSLASSRYESIDGTHQ